MQALWLFWPFGDSSQQMWVLQLRNAITLKPWGVMWHSTYHQKWHDMCYPSRIFLPVNISKLIPLYIKQIWVHYPNLYATEIHYQNLFKGWNQWKQTQIINIIMGARLGWPICTHVSHGKILTCEPKSMTIRLTIIPSISKWTCGS